MLEGPALPSLLVQTPTIDNHFHGAFLKGALQTQARFAGRIAFETATGYLPCARDSMTARFLDSSASHMLCVDSDIGWGPDDVEALLATGKDVVSGVYARRQESREPPVKLNGEVEGKLAGCTSVPAGFLLISRACIERMIGAYRNLLYQKDGQFLYAIWGVAQFAVTGEDIAFCNRWRAIGGKIWLHTEVHLQHWGDCCFMPDLSTLKIDPEALKTAP